MWMHRLLDSQSAFKKGMGLTDALCTIRISMALIAMAAYIS